MSYERELTTFKKGNQLSTCGKYNLQDLSDMFSQTEIGGVEEYIELEDILNEDNTVLSMSVTIMEQLNDDSMDMYIIKSEDEHCDCGNELEGKDVICESCEDEITDEYIITKLEHDNISVSEKVNHFLADIGIIDKHFEDQIHSLIIHYAKYKKYKDDNAVKFEDYIANVNTGYDNIIVPCSAELDNQMYNESI